jgi:predicted HTH transcriptional regulator
MNIHSTFDTLDLEAIRNFVAERKEETLDLDFKVISNPELKSRDDKRNLARAISGFANASGGLIVWGVNARKNDEGIDSAVALCEKLANLSRNLPPDLPPTRCGLERPVSDEASGVKKNSFPS